MDKNRDSQPSVEVTHIEFRRN